MSFLIDFILHIDQHLANLVQHFGPWTYVILFAIIFIETGSVIFPFLPGDSLLFAAGAISVTPAGESAGLNHWVFMLLFFVAAVAGDTLNYWIGRKGGYPLLQKPIFKRFIKDKYIQEAEEFYQKHGGKAIILGRYIPIVRTFVPFVAGISQFSFGTFFRYVLIAAFSWSFIATGAGALFGNIPFIQEHFSAIILGIVFVTLLPTLVPLVRSLLARRKQKS
ncbi:VTT domain-containing protein [Leuconostocaceae bacterium ESL0723]|nr:VTT domain-containing protein [Lactobacillaceae bacterium L1_55_11]WEV54047.1 VTT domain-containing protein [Leuconostocaceae bacterium ESL0723]